MNRRSLWEELFEESIHIFASNVQTYNQDAPRHFLSGFTTLAGLECSAEQKACDAVHLKSDHRFSSHVDRQIYFLHVRSSQAREFTRTKKGARRLFSRVTVFAESIESWPLPIHARCSFAFPTTFNVEGLVGYGLGVATSLAARGAIAGVAAVD